MKTVKDILSHKGNELYTIAPDASVYDALVLMAQKDIGALVVLEKDRVTGIISERDYARKVILRGESSKEMTVHKIMTRSVVCVAPKESVQKCMDLMTRERIRHLPVVSGDKLTGVISIGDVVKAMMSEQEQLIEQLEGYIRGG